MGAVSLISVRVAAGLVVKFGGLHKVRTPALPMNCLKADSRWLSN